MKANHIEHRGDTAFLPKNGFEIDALRAARRRYPRIAKNLIIGFRKIDSAGQYNSAVTEDISMGGFRINAAFFGNPLSANDTIEIIIRDPRENTDPIIAIGRVAWMKKKSGNNCEIGVMLVNIAQKHRKNFTQYLKI